MRIINFSHLHRLCDGGIVSPRILHRERADGQPFRRAPCGLTPAAVGRNVARLETHLGLRFFHRSTRSLTLTAGGEEFLHEVTMPFADLRGAFSRAARNDGKPAGTLKLSVAVAFGREYLVPMLGEFLRRYPAILPDWRLDNRPIACAHGRCATTKVNRRKPNVARG